MVPREGPRGPVASCDSDRSIGPVRQSMVGGLAVAVALADSIG